MLAAASPWERWVLRDHVYLVGLRYRHHAQRSGYEAFNRYVGTPLPSPVGFRWTNGRIGYPLNQGFCRAVGHPWYSLGAHVTEWGALGHMARHRGRLYHILYGDTDLWLLRRAHRLTGNRLLATFHQPSSQLRALGTIERVARHLDAAVLVCEAQRPYFEEFLPAGRIFVIPHGVDTSWFHPPETPAADDLTCVTIGAHLRDFDTLAQAMTRVWQQEPRVRFICVGTRRDKKFFFTGMDDPRVTYLDGVSDDQLRAQHHAARVAVFSLGEATANNAVLEAMASGLPVVATDVGGVRDYVGADNGVLCPEKDPQAMADGILRVLFDRDAAERMGRASRMKALARDYCAVAHRMRSLYEQVLSR